MLEKLCIYYLANRKIKKFLRSDNMLLEFWDFDIAKTYPLQPDEYQLIIDMTGRGQAVAIKLEHRRLSCRDIRKIARRLAKIITISVVQ